MAGTVEVLGKRTVQAKLGRYLKDLLYGIRLKYQIVNMLCGVLPDGSSGVLRTWLYRKIGFDIAPGAFIMGNLHLVGGAESFYDKLHIGPRVIAGPQVTINLDADVTVGKHVSIGPGVTIYTGTHPIGPGSQRRLPELVARPVTVEDGCWIGLAAIILPGVTIGHGSVVAAGAVVTHDVAPDSYVEGNPAQVVRTLPWGSR